jgi:hypothetical protein
MFFKKKKSEFETLRVKSFEVLSSAVMRFSEQARENYPTIQNAKYDVMSCSEIITNLEQLNSSLNRIKGHEYEVFVMKEALNQSVLGLRSLIDTIWNKNKCSGSSSQE